MASLLDLAHGDVRRTLAGGAPVFLPVNPVEYHGPHLSLHNDALVSQGLIRDLHRALTKHHPEWPLLAAADLEVGVDPVPGPGSRPVPFSVVRRLVIDAALALADLGARRVVLMSFHGSPLHNLALEAGVEALTARGVQAFAPLNLVLGELLAVDPGRYAAIFTPIADPAERAATQAELPHDFHAGYMETSLALHYAPDSVSPSHVDLPPCPPPRPQALALAAARVARRLGARRLSAELDFVATGLGWYALRPFPGYTGRPHLATAEAGRVLAELVVTEFQARAEAIFAGQERSPPPIMPWMTAASFGGRAGIPGAPRTT